MNTTPSIIHESVTPQHLQEAATYHRNERQFARNTNEGTTRRFTDQMEGHMWTEYGFDNLKSWDNVFRFYFQDHLGLEPQREIVAEDPFAPNAEPTRTEGELMINQLLNNFSNDPNILEIAGPGGFIRRTKKHGKSLAVSLGDGRSQSLKLHDKQNNIDLIEADLLTEDGHGEESQLGGWEDINKWMETESIEGFDLIVSNPIGGWENLPQNLEIYKILIKRVTAKLKDDGLLLLRIPETWAPETVKLVTKRYLNNDDKHFEVHTGPGGLVVKKLPEKPIN